MCPCLWEFKNTTKIKNNANYSLMTVRNIYSLFHFRCADVCNCVPWWCGSADTHTSYASVMRVVMWRCWEAPASSGQTCDSSSCLTCSRKLTNTRDHITCLKLHKRMEGRYTVNMCFYWSESWIINARLWESSDREDLITHLHFSRTKVKINSFVWIISKCPFQLID